MKIYGFNLVINKVFRKLQVIDVKFKVKYAHRNSSGNHNMNQNLQEHQHQLKYIKILGLLLLKMAS